MKIGIMTRDQDGWCTTQLRKAIQKKNITPLCFEYPEIIGRINYTPEASVNKVDILRGLNALISRPIARGSVDELLFRMDLLHRLERLGLPIINPPLSIERAVNKYYSLSLFQENGLPVPRTAVTENPDEALKCFHELGGDVVVKPLFGSRGLGATRITDPDIATRVFLTISFYHGVLYLQEFIPHGGSDIRAFVVGDRVVAAMRRMSTNWKTNVSLGAKPVSLNLSRELETLAVKAANVVGCKVAGVDIIEGPKGPVVIELNSQPGWKGLQSVTKTNIADEIISYILSELKS
ncbi:MAG TPA: RimK family alpha-L-glutamate ligase [Candidatus Bathyarchaeota archaeon]|nr:RimK family alpha-L-glutamate ligase [Candidatus Bathyarchaeota archaeon]